jgi:hypothetical protein
MDALRVTERLFTTCTVSAEYSRSAIRLAKTTPRTTTITIASSNGSLGAFEKPMSPGFQDLPRVPPQRM